MFLRCLSCSGFFAWNDIAFYQVLCYIYWGDHTILFFILLMWFIYLSVVFIDLCMLYHPWMFGVKPTWSRWKIHLKYCWILFPSILLRIFASVFIKHIIYGFISLLGLSGFGVRWCWHHKSVWKDGLRFYFIFFIQIANLRILIGEFKPFVLKVYTDSKWFSPAIFALCFLLFGLGFSCDFFFLRGIVILFSHHWVWLAFFFQSSACFSIMFVWLVW